MKPKTNFHDVDIKVTELNVFYFGDTVLRTNSKRFVRFQLINVHIYQLRQVYLLFLYRCCMVIDIFDILYLINLYVYIFKWKSIMCSLPWHYNSGLFKNVLSLWITFFKFY